MWTSLTNNWIVRSQNRLLNFNKSIGLDFRHLPCYENTFLINCIFTHETVVCAKCQNTLEITYEDFKALVYAT